MSTLLAPVSGSALELNAWSLGLGAGGGYTHIDPRQGQGTSKNGYHLIASGLAEAESGEWIAGLEGGFFYNRVYSDGERDFAGSQPLTVKEQRKLRIETRAGSAALAGRYRIGLGLEAGLILRSFFGSSLSFSQDRGNAASKFFIGPQAVWRWAGDHTLWQRLDLSLTRDLNVPQKSVYLLTLGVAIGRTWAQPAPAPVVAPAPEDRYEEILADKIINFPTASSELQGPARSFLQELGQFMRSEAGLWKEVEIEGHTDSKGKLAYNMKLSQDRANTVRRLLMEQGVPDAKVKAQGFGPTRPLIEGTSPEALAANRRVVMIFNVSDREGRNRLSSFIRDLRKKYFNE